MKKILLIVNGLIAEEFLQRISDDFVNTNEYYVVYYEDEILPSKKSENFKYFKFDPTSYAKLSTILKRENFFQVLIILSNKIDVEAVIKNIRMVRKDILISVMDRWNLDINGKNIQRINANDVVINRLIHTLPNVPVIAHNIGLGIGEIMEISIPFTSSYVYRHISSIEQKDWKIVGIYRNNKLIIARDTLMIQPNDIMLSIGNPDVLKQVFRSVKQDMGQFPAPFGNNIYVLIDMRVDNKESIIRNLEAVRLLDAKLKNRKVIIKILNPNDINLLEFIKRYDLNFNICINYYQDKTLSELLYEDNKVYNIGLVVTSRVLFEHRNNKTTLFLAKVPVLKIGRKDFSTIENSIVLLSNNQDLERTSSIMFDISAQLNINLKLLDLDPEGDFKEGTIEFFQNISKIFSKDVEIISDIKNPIREAKKMDNFLHFIPFNRDIVRASIFSIFSTRVERLYYKLDDYNQLLIPVLI